MQLVILRTARYDDPAEEVEFGEISVFLSSKFVITVRQGVASELRGARARLEQRSDLLDIGTPAVLWAILDSVVDAYAPVVAGLERDIDQIEATVFSGAVAPTPARPPDLAPVGTATVQVLRTYPSIRPGYPFAPDGERSVARGYRKVLGRARRMVYLQDQYMWSPHIARLLAAALRRNPQLHLMVVLPRHSDVDGRFSLPPNQVGRLEALPVCRRAAADRVHVFDLENHHGTPVYVDAKVAEVDDVWAAVGSANLNRRSWSHDSELTAAVLDEHQDGRAPAAPADHGDPARRFARELRPTLLREHLDRPAGEDTDLLDPAAALHAVEAAADALDAWYRAGRVGPRPPGRLRHHQPERMATAHQTLGRARLPTHLRPGRPLVARPTSPSMVTVRHRGVDQESMSPRTETPITPSTDGADALKVTSTMAMRTAPRHCSPS